MPKEPTTDLAEVLGRTYWEILHQHDQKDWNGQGEAIKRQLQALFGRAPPEVVAHVVRAYQLADEAETHQQNERKTEENQAYHQAGVELSEAIKKMGGNPKAGEKQARWWKDFRHKNLIRGTYHLFAHQRQSLGGSSRALKATYFLLQAGRAHRKRDKTGETKAYAKFWHHALKHTKGAHRWHLL